MIRLDARGQAALTPDTLKPSNAEVPGSIDRKML